MKYIEDMPDALVIAIAKMAYGGGDINSEFQFLKFSDGLSINCIKVYFEDDYFNMPCNVSVRIYKDLNVFVYRKVSKDEYAHGALIPTEQQYMIQLHLRNLGYMPR